MKVTPYGTHVVYACKYHKAWTVVQDAVDNLTKQTRHQATDNYQTLTPSIHHCSQLGNQFKSTDFNNMPSKSRHEKNKLIIYYKRPAIPQAWSQETSGPLV